MTNEEVIESLEHMISENCTDNQHAFVDEVKIAIEAVKKQIPQKPISLIICGVRCLRCPICNRGLFAEEYYCATCGQRINRG